MSERIRVRIAPSPTGIPHIGNTRTALYNYLLAKKHGGDFILRIEDTDQKRLVPEALEAIDEILDWLGFTPDERYVQSERIDIYKKHAQKLVDKGLAYEDARAIRFKIPKGKKISWTDAVGSKEISFASEDVEDFIILKSDGYPTYHLASVVDDHLMEISHVIRGEEWISSTPKHLLLYEAFGWEPPIFVHMPVILGPDKGKLSKRHGAKSVLDYREEGFLKEAIINFMALLGWNPGGEQEVMPLEEMIQKFELKDINTGSPVFDIQKLSWMNGEWIRKTQNEKLKMQILQLKTQSFPEINDELFDKLLDIAKTRMKRLSEFEQLVRPFTEKRDVSLDTKQEEHKQELKNRLDELENWNQATILDTLLLFLKEKEKRFPYIYELLIGEKQGLPLADTFEILGKDKTISLFD